MNWLKNIFHVAHEAEKVPIDKLQLDAAQERLNQRSVELSEGVDDLTKMFRRLQRKPPPSRSRNGNKRS